MSTIRVEVIADDTGADGVPSGDEAKAVALATLLCEGLRDAGFTVTSAAVHGGVTLPGGLATIVPLPASDTPVAPTSEAGGGEPAWGSTATGEGASPNAC